MQFSNFMHRFQKSLSLCIIFLLVFLASGAEQFAPAASAAPSTWEDLDPDPTGELEYDYDTLSDIVFGNGEWLVANGSGFLGYSANGTDWQHPEESTVIGLQVLSAAFYAGDRWVGVGQSGVYLTSSPVNTLNAWKVYSGGMTPTTENLRDVTYGVEGTNGIPYTVLVGDNGAILVSVDNDSFSSTPSKNDDSYLLAAAYGNGRFVAAGYNSDFSGGIVYYSVDGETFNAGAVSTGVADVAFGKGKFVAVGASGFVATSMDGQTWTPQTVPAGAASATLNGVAFGGGKFVAVGNGGVIISSEDGVTWDTETPKTSVDFKSVAYGEDLFVIVGPAGLMQISNVPDVVANPLVKLTDLEVNPPGGLVFDPDDTTYAVTVPHETASVTVTPTLPVGASATVNGSPLVGGAATVTLDADGVTDIDVDVTADGHDPNQYTITVTEQELVKLTDLEVTPPGGLAFDPNTKVYSVSVPNGTASVEVTPSLPAGASATVNGAALIGGKSTVTLDANGTTAINVNVTAPDHTANSYTITVTEDAPLAVLADLEVTPPGNLVFDPNTTSYPVSVEYGTDSVVVTPALPVVPGANVTVNGSPLVEGSATVTLDADGTTVIDVDVTADDHNPNQYTITVTEKALVKLTGLEVTPPGGLAFHEDTTAYPVTVTNGTASVEVTPSAPAYATVTVNGAALVDGKSTVTLDASGTTVIDVDVSAPGYTSNQYTITVTEQELIKLTGLEVTPPGGLAFHENTTAYPVTVTNGTASVEVTPSAPAYATVTVNGAALVDGKSTVTLDADGTTVINVDVSAPGYTSNQYTITVTEEELAKLVNLTVTPGGLTFIPDTTSYPVEVPYGTASVDVTPTLPPAIGAVVTVNGAALVDGKSTVTLDASGTTVIDVDVSAPGYTSNQYTITVTEQELIKLTGLEVTPPGGLAFHENTTAYPVTVTNGTASVEVTPSAPAYATVTVNGAALVDGKSTVTLDASGTTVIDVDVSAPGYTSNQYTITVTEEELAKLVNLTVTPGGLAFNPNTTSYPVAVSYGTASVDVTPTLPPAIGAVVTVNGAALVDGKSTVTLDASGTTVINVNVTAPGYTNNQYTITVTEQELIKLTGLEVTPPGGLAFHENTTAYPVTVTNGTASVEVTPSAPAYATVTVNGAALVDGKSTVTLDASGTTVIDVDVSAPGYTSNQYTITVTEEELVKLTGLEVTPPGGLTFDADTTAYPVTAPYGTTSVDVTPSVPAGAAATVNGAPLVDGKVTVTLDADGTTVINVNVTAPGYTANEYTITVTEGAPSANANLSNLILSPGTLTEGFASNLLDYTSSVGYEVNTLTVTPVLADGTATLTVNGNVVENGNAEPINLNVGPNTITVLVTAQDGIATQTYTITVTRAEYVSPPVDDKVKGTLQGNITKLIGNGAKLSADVYSADGKTLVQSGVEVNGANGKFELTKIEPGSYRMVLYVLADNGVRLAGQTATMSVSSDKTATASASVIDPFGIVRDAMTEKAVDGVKVTVYWADTARNKSLGRTPGTQVVLPTLSSMTNKNENGQLTKKDGQFGWLLLPDGDYYIMAEKDGYEVYDGTGAVFQVGTTAVKNDLTLEPKVLEEGIIEPYITGYPDGTFKPDRGITRAELAAVLLRVMNIKAETQLGDYSDVTSSNWAAPAIAEVTKRGLMVGYPDGTFQPNRQITRAEIAIVLGKVKQLPAEKGNASFKDLEKHWAKDAILLAAEAGLISGHTDGSYRPDNALTRAEAVVIFNKVLGWNDLNVDKAQRWSDVPKNYWAYKDIMRASVPHAYQKLGNGMVIWQ